MPRRGYRKGQSDSKEPRPHVIKSRATDRTFWALHDEAASRSMTFSALVAEILDAYRDKRREQLPTPRAAQKGALLVLERLANNVNQIARQANLMRLHLVEADARRLLARLHAVIDTLL